MAALLPYTSSLSAPQGPEGQGGCFDSPSLGPLDSLPTRNDQGVSPWTQKAEGRGRDMPEKMPSLASARAFFPGGISPPLRLHMRALRARPHHDGQKEKRPFPGAV